MKRIALTAFLTGTVLLTAPALAQTDDNLKESCFSQLKKSALYAPTEEVLELCEQAIAQNPDDIELSAQLGAAYLRLKKWEYAPRASSLTIAAAEKGHLASMTRLGTLYMSVGPVLQDYEKARKWLLKPAEAGDPSAQNMLGILYEAGLGVAADPQVAAEWFARAAATNDATAQTDLAVEYLSNRVVPPNPAKAARLLSPAVEQDHAKAQSVLGDLYYHGNGVPPGISTRRSLSTKSPRLRGSPMHSTIWPFAISPVAACRKTGKRRCVGQNQQLNWETVVPKACWVRCTSRVSESRKTPNLRLSGHQRQQELETRRRRTIWGSFSRTVSASQRTNKER
ncbi:sel1 repeat family protein [Denitrobaculum tricleocarpae]|uniref:Sel1 repeat family protein n=1 Tax=Denitrobaculum tricleocarpae TaxID=2591009 RepID=A0A545TME2_9PROT|nr:tetratricopeptide repeat protein [Denitrobaculum tricleocarpae]TQV78405.1 sel1 repeat family protein [Denitrobaculum tricleocarpae]